MESTLVSARIPHAKKEAGVALLGAMGATTSDLINSAFDYLIERKNLPSADMPARRDANGFTRFVTLSTLDIDWGPEAETLDYKAMIREGRRADYESLA